MPTLSNLAKSLLENKLHCLAARTEADAVYFEKICARIAAHIISGAAYV